MVQLIIAVKTWLHLCPSIKCQFDSLYFFNLFIHDGIMITIKTPLKIFQFCSLLLNWWIHKCYDGYIKSSICTAYNCLYVVARQLQYKCYRWITNSIHRLILLIFENIFLTCRSCFYHIRDLRRIRRYFSLSVHKPNATALITSRLDYCKSLLYNIASKDILKLHCVQNCLARVVTRSPRFSRFVPLLKFLHCLHV